MFNHISDSVLNKDWYLITSVFYYEYNRKKIIRVIKRRMSVVIIGK